MTLRMLDLVFRHKILLALPIVLGLIGGIAWYALTMKDEYQSTASIEVSPSTYGPSAFQYNPYISAAQNQANFMVQWLSTREFTDRVVQRANTDGSGCPPERITRLALLDGSAIYPSGDTLVEVTYRASTSCMAPIVVNALLSEYATYFNEKIRERAATDKETLRVQLEQARADEDLAFQEYNAYLSTRPDLADIDPDSPSAATQGDAQFNKLNSSLQTAKGITNRTASLLAQAEVAAAAPEGQGQGFEIVDDPSEPTIPLVLGTRSMLTKPMLGLLLGMFASASVLLLLLRMDKTVRLPSDLAFLQTSAPIMALPDLNARRRNWPPSFVRLATAIQNGLSHFG